MNLKKWENYFKSEHEWWKSGWKDFARIALIMEQKGFDAEYIKQLLSDLYSVVADEYGD